jgi:hypothetical protein
MKDPDELNDADLVGYAEEFKVEPGAAPTKGAGPSGLRGLLALLVEHPLRNGGLALLTGLTIAGLSVASAVNGGFYLPFVMLAASALAGAGLCVGLVPPPENAHQLLTEGGESDDAFRFWQLIVLCFTAVGGGLGMALRFWLSG